MFLLSSCSYHCPIHWSQVLGRKWRYRRSSADRQCFNYIWVIDNVIAHKGATYIRDFYVLIPPSPISSLHRTNAFGARVLLWLNRVMGYQGGRPSDGRRTTCPTRQGMPNSLYSTYNCKRAAAIKMAGHSTKAYRKKFKYGSPARDPELRESP